MKWESVGYGITRFSVPGGWIYCCRVSGTMYDTEQCIFVPEPQKYIPEM